MTYPERLDLTVFIGGVDVTAYVQPGSMQIVSVLTYQSDTCKLLLEDASGLTIGDWEEIVILDGGTRIFAGYAMVTASSEIGLEENLQVQGVSYEALLEKVVIKKQYTSAITDAAILTDLFAMYLSEIDTSTLQPGHSYERVRFNRWTLRKVIDFLSDNACADWYIDANKTLHYFTGEENSAPFELSDDPDLSDSMPYTNLQLNLDGSGVVNRVEVVGGYYVSQSDETFILAGTGQDERVSLPFKLHAGSGSAIEVWRNDGTEAAPSWTALTVKVGYIDELSSTSEVLYYFETQVLEQQDNWPNLTNAVMVTGRREIPILTRVRDDESYKHYGRWFDGVIKDTEINDLTTARLRAQGYLAQNALSQPAITLTCYAPGLRSGQTVHITNTRRGITDDYLIQRVSVTVGINGQAQYDVEAGTYNPDLVALLVALKRSTETVLEWRDDETLNEVLIQSEALGLSEGVHNMTATSGPYKWSPTVDGAFNWSFGKWA